MMSYIAAVIIDDLNLMMFYIPAVIIANIDDLNDVLGEEIVAINIFRMKLSPDNLTNQLIIIFAILVLLAIVILAICLYRLR